MAPNDGDFSFKLVIYLIFTVFLSVVTSNFVQYSREDLLLLRDRTYGPNFTVKRSDFDEFLEWTESEDRKLNNCRKRGRRSGHLVRSRRRLSKVPVPSIVLSNVRSVLNKSDELSFRVQNLKDYKNACAICLTETWLTPAHPDSLVQPSGFTMYRRDRDRVITGKDKGGGVCLLVNESWCSDVKIVSQDCSTDIEFLTIKCRPFYLPREFSSVTMTAVYIHPKADSKVALDTLRKVIASTENSDPDTLSIVLGDFNQVNMRTVLPDFRQQVTCPTRGDRTLDHCYCKLKGAYKSVPRANFGNSDHSTVLLIPAYKQKLKQSKPTQRTIQVWSQESVDQLQDCFEQTNWDLFKEGNDLDQCTETVTDYIRFCEELCVPTKVKTLYPNNKPWFNKVVRSRLVAKDQAFRDKESDPESYRRAKSDLNKAIRDTKREYKERIEDNFATDDPREAWANINLVTNYKGAKRSASTDDASLPDKLNEFYARFDKENHEAAVAPSEAAAPSLVIEPWQVQNKFRRLKERKAAGPDDIKPRILKNCAAQLAQIFSFIFNWSLSLNRVPTLWKQAVVVPVPKKARVTCLNDLRPVALTSVPMKTFEGMILHHLKSLIPRTLDPYQFAYRANRSVEDAISIFLHEILNHLDKKNSYVRILFIDYSSAFNTIIPSKLYVKLLEILKLPRFLCNWILDFLLDRRQVVKVGSNVSETMVLNTGTPQGCVLSPILYSLFTHDCVASENNCFVAKFADDTTVSGMISNNDETSYRAQVESIVKWCADSNLILNTAKTKEMIIDFRKNVNEKLPIMINGEAIEQVEEFKFLGTILSSDLSWHVNSNSVLKKSRQRLYFLRKLKQFGVSREILIQFYGAIIQSILCNSITVWFGRVSSSDLGKLNSVVRAAEKIIGCGLPSLQSLYNDRIVKKAKSIVADESHPARGYFNLLPSGRRYRTFRGNKRFVNSCYPSAVKILNSYY